MADSQTNWSVTVGIVLVGYFVSLSEFIINWLLLARFHKLPRPDKSKVSLEAVSQGDQHSTQVFIGL